MGVGYFGAAHRLVEVEFAVASESGRFRSVVADGDDGDRMDQRLLNSLRE